ncbi:MAG TPA: PAS domain S-box protein [Candidatus Nanoarchaeia archaeon]|nr:PAS domain S-box protein [Candidatus Nanoarchaeia archaeon]
MDPGEVKLGPIKRVLHRAEGFTYGLSRRYTRWQRLGITVVICVVVQLVRIQFGLAMTNMPYLVAFLVALLVGWFLGPLAGELAVFLGAAGYVYYFVPPYFNINPSRLSPAGQAKLLSYLLLSTFVNFMFGLLRYARGQSELRGERLRALIDGSGQAILLLDTDTRLLFANKSFERLMGYEISYKLDTKLVDLVHASDFDKTIGRIENLISDQTQLGLSARIKHANGSWRWVDMTGTNMLNNPAINALVFTFHDITVRKLAELELKDSEERLALAQSAARIGTFDWNIHSHEVAWSVEMERIYGLPPGGFDGKFKHWMSLVHRADLDQVQSKLSSSVETGQPLEVDFRISLANGETRWVAAKGTVVRDKDNKPFRVIGVNSDFTERKRSEDTQKFMVQASKILSSSLDYESNITEVAQLAARTIADWCQIDMLTEDGGIQNLAVAHCDATRLHLARAMSSEYPPMRPTSGIKKAMETGEAFLMENVSDEVIQQIAEDERHLQLMKEVGIRSLMLVPIKTRGRTVGVITLVLAESHLQYTRSDLGVARSLAERIAAAIDNAKLFRQVRAANADLEKRVDERTEDLRRSEEQYRLMFESLQDVYYRTDEASRIILISPSVETSWGYKPEEIIGHQASEFYFDPVVERSKFLKEIEQKGEVTDFEVRLKGKDGKVMYVSITAHIYKDWSGKMQGVEGIIRDVTERRLAEQQLNREQKFIRELIHSSKDGMLALDKNLRYTVWNPGMEALTGLTAHEVLGKAMQEVLPELIEDGVLPNYISQALEGHASETGTMHYAIRGTGRQGYFDSRYSPIYDEKGEVVGALGVIRDVTERHLADEKILASQTALQEAQAMASIGSWEWDIEKDVITWSEELHRLFEVDKANFSMDYEAYLSRLPENERHKTDDLIKEARRTGGNFDFEHRIIRHDGSERIIHATGQAVTDGSKRVVKMRGTAQDITDRKLAEEILRESEERFRSIVDGVRDYAILMLDPSGRVVSWNTGAERIKGYQAHEILGKHFSVFYTKEDVESGKPTKALEIAAKSGSYHQDGLRVRKDGSTFMANILISALYTPEGTLRGYTKVTRDITEQKKIEQMKGDFVSLVSHQLKTPAALVRGYVDNLLSGITGELNEKQIEYLRDIQDISTKNYGLITDLLNVSRIERGVIAMDIRPVKLRDIMHLALRSHQPRLVSKGIKLVTRYGNSEVLVLADKFKTAEAISNIVDNAIKFTSQGAITIQASSKDNKLEVTVADTGSGIPNELMLKLFTRDQIFSGSPRPEGGSGLGLYIAKQFMQAQSGDISVESEAGRGTKFTFSLPLAKVKKSAEGAKVAK